MELVPPSGSVSKNLFHVNIHRLAKKLAKIDKTN